MKVVKLSVVLVSTVLMLAGCKTIHKLDRSEEYKKALPHDQSLVLPSDIGGGAIENLYPIPKVQDSKNVTDVSTVPPGSKI